MDDDQDLIVIAAYADVDTARDDFLELEHGLERSLEVRGAALVSKNEDGVPTVTEAANRHGRLGIGVGAGVGALFGLFAPPLGLSILIGAAAGGLLASFAEHEVRSGLRGEVGQALETGTAVIIAITYPNGRGPFENTVHHAEAFRELRLGSSTVRSVEASIADAMREIGHETGGSLSTDTTDTNS